MDYQFVFPSLTNELTLVDANGPKGKFSFEVKTIYKDFILTYEATQYPIVFDFLDLATAIYMADWLAPRKRTEKRVISIELPLRYAMVFNQSDVLNDLQKILLWYTSDEWFFKFVPHDESLRSVGQVIFDFPTPLTEVALWSGGLDSLLGLLQRYHEFPQKKYILVGSGFSEFVQGKQKAVFDELCEQFPKQFEQQFQLVQIPIQPTYSNNLPKNEYFRSRGLVYKLIGACVATVNKQNSLFVYENGYGAINLPFLSSGLAIDNTRSIHPKSLLDLNLFVTKILGKSFLFTNPFVFHTKGEMCKGLEKFSPLMSKTFSCDSRARICGQSGHCGYCSSCILRCISLLSAFGSDETIYRITHPEYIFKKEHYQHFEGMRRQIINFKRALFSPNPWEKLQSMYPHIEHCIDPLMASMDLSDEEVKQKLLTMYTNYYKEWQSTEKTLNEFFPITNLMLRQPKGLLNRQTSPRNLPESTEA